MLAFLRRLFGKRSNGTDARRGVSRDYNEVGAQLRWRHDGVLNVHEFVLTIEDRCIYDVPSDSIVRAKQSVALSDRLRALAGIVADIERDFDGKDIIEVKDVRLVSISLVDNPTDPACRIGDGPHGFAIGFDVGCAEDSNVVTEKLPDGTYRHTFSGGPGVKFFDVNYEPPDKPAA